MNKANLLVLLMFSLPLVGCLHTGPYTGPYTANSPVVLVEPTHRAWLKPASTTEDETQAMRECGDERRSNEELRNSSMKVRSDAYTACMNRKGFRYYKDR
jgi:hypothetical protein